MTDESGLQTTAGAEGSRRCDRACRCSRYGGGVMLCAGGGFSFGATPEDEADALQKVSFFPTTSEAARGSSRDASWENV